MQQLFWELYCRVNNLKFATEYISDPVWLVCPANSAHVRVNHVPQPSLTLFWGLNTSWADRARGGLWVIRSKYKLEEAEAEI